MEKTHPHLNPIDMSLKDFTPEELREMFPYGIPTKEEVDNYDNSGNFPPGRCPHHVSKANAEKSAKAKDDRAKTNRENAQKSTGPASGSGKQAVRFNALKFGIYSEAKLIPGEDPAQYDRLEATIKAIHQPSTPEAQELVDNLLTAEWRHRRLVRAESQVLEAALYQQSQKLAEEIEFDPEDEETRLNMAMGMAQMTANGTLTRIQRTLTRLERQIKEIKQELKELKAAQAEQTKAREAQNGFVPSNRENRANVPPPNHPEPEKGACSVPPQSSIKRPERSEWR
jgi:hypothetical protein